MLYTGRQNNFAKSVCHAAVGPLLDKIVDFLNLNMNRSSLTLLGTNISPPKACLKMFLFPFGGICDPSLWGSRKEHESNIKHQLACNLGSPPMFCSHPRVQNIQPRSRASPFASWFPSSQTSKDDNLLETSWAILPCCPGKMKSRMQSLMCSFIYLLVH